MSDHFGDGTCRMCSAAGVPWRVVCGVRCAVFSLEMWKNWARCKFNCGICGGLRQGRCFPCPVMCVFEATSQGTHTTLTVRLSLWRQRRRGWDSLPTVAAGCWMDGRGCIPSRSKRVSSALGPTRPPIQWAPGGLPPPRRGGGVKRSGT